MDSTFVVHMIFMQSDFHTALGNITATVAGHSTVGMSLYYDLECYSISTEMLQYYNMK